MLIFSDRAYRAATERRISFNRNVLYIGISLEVGSNLGLYL